FRGKAGVAHLNFRVINDPQVAFLAYQRGEVDIVEISPDQLPSVKGPLQQQLVRALDGCSFYLGFNMTKPPFNNLKVRQAFAYALNRDQYIKQINAGVGKPSGQFLLPEVPGYTNKNSQTYDPAKAKQLLAEAGYPNGQGFPAQKFNYDVSGGATTKKRALFYQQNFKQVLNVDIQPNPVDPNTYQDQLNIKSKNPPIFRLGWCQDYPHPQDWYTLVFANNSPLSPAGWNDPKFNELTDKADQLPLAQAIPLYQQANQILLDKVPVAYTFYGEVLALFKPNVKGVQHHLGDVEGWYYESNSIYKTK
ncbi:MAG: ABC transporter substrate-binding protein, partial [Chloroflexota bacterium]|nr:ABC transporter substrate-binding protein [Chloroflexota bacterium]